MFAVGKYESAFIWFCLAVPQNRISTSSSHSAVAVGWPVDLNWYLLYSACDGKWQSNGMNPFCS